MTISYDDKVKAFLRDLASSCANCLRRMQGLCETCAANRAKQLLGETTSSRCVETPKLELSYVERYAKILEIVRSSPRPLAAREIDLSDYCSKGLKYWTLRRLVQIGRLEMITVDGEYRFYVKQPKRMKQNGK